MSAISKYFQVTDQILIEYSYDQYNTLGTKLQNTQDYQLSYHKPFVVKQLNGRLTIIDNCTENNLFNSLSYLYFNNDRVNGDNYWLGYKVNNDAASFSLSSDSVGAAIDSLIYNGKLNPLATDVNYRQFTTGSLAWDKIRIYFITGYIMNSINGFLLKISATRNSQNSTVSAGGQLKTIRTTEDVDLLNFFFSKDRLASSIKWKPTPFYMSGKFYDRYIELEVPSTYSLGLLNHNNPNATDTIYNLLNINADSLIKMNFSILSNTDDTEELDYSSYLNSTVKDNLGFSNGLNLPNLEENEVSGTIALKSNADYFNIRIYEDTDANAIIYYPIWGDDVEAVDLNTNIMNSIEGGSIPLLVNGFLDEGDVESFTDTYGDDARKWIIYNEVIVTYTYQPVYYSNESVNGDNSDIQTSETLTNVIDYSNKTSADGQFWRSTFRPVIKKRTGYECNYLTLTYNCHLINRLNNSEIIRTASINVSNAESKFSEKAKMIDVSNIATWKIVNKINKNEIITQTNNQSSNANERYIRTFYNANDIVIKDVTNSGQVYTQGNMILYLFKTTTDYLFQLYKNDSNGVRVPFDLTGPYNYKLIFPTKSGNGKIEKTPVLSNVQTNLGLGTLLFNITEDEVKRIMEVTSSDRYFAIVCDNSDNKTENTTIYEGHVEYRE